MASLSASKAAERAAKGEAVVWDPSWISSEFGFRSQCAA